MAESVMLDRAKDFAVEIVNLCRNIQTEQKEYVLTGQLLRCGTSIGANIHESKYAQSPADFVSKLQIALKESYESEYWLELLNRTGLLPDDRYDVLRSACGTLRRMLISSVNTAKKRNSASQS